jgi:hypothetical protein
MTSAAPTRTFEHFGSGLVAADPSWYQKLNTPYYTPSHVAWRAKVREFMDREVMPIVSDWDKQVCSDSRLARRGVFVWNKREYFRKRQNHFTRYHWSSTVVLFTVTVARGWLCAALSSIGNCKTLSSIGKGWIFRDDVPWQGTSTWIFLPLIEQFEISLQKPLGIVS